jgi:hypothetical protein
MATKNLRPDSSDDRLAGEAGGKKAAQDERFAGGVGRFDHL